MIMKIQFEGRVKRIYDETRGSYTHTYVVVTDDAEKYPETLRFKMKNGTRPPCGEDDRVKVAAYLHGREWTPNDGEPRYFTDLGVDTIDVLEAANGGAGDSNGAVTDWKSLLAFGAKHGEDEAKVKARCVAYQKKVNRRFTAEDYGAIAGDIACEHTPPEADSFDNDMPF